MPLTVATYNIHRCIGRDRKLRPDRIVQVLKELRADVVALQEVETLDDGGLDLLEHFTDETGLAAIAGTNIFRHGVRYGNALLTRLPVLTLTRPDLSYPGRERRGAIDVLLDWSGTPLRVVATHLGLSGRERRWQLDHLLARFRSGNAAIDVLLGDINEWRRRGRAQRWLDAYFPTPPMAPATFPAFWPLLALDQIRVQPRCLLQDLSVHASPMARQASDHLPLIARIERPQN
jgi:endonuclease/exonuclease/phosphatase family metal-dependent hydrolase